MTGINARLSLIRGQTAEELNGCWTLGELRQFAKELGVKRVHARNKAQLAMAIEDEWRIEHAKT